MSAYLLFFGLGDFERVRRTVRGVDLGVVVKRGDLAAGAYALDAAAHLLEYYEDYFAARFPLPKLDLIAGPGSSQIFGAMENWGAIFAFERDLLIDPRVANQADRQNVYSLVAHEMAHQWFGDLVTMNWWDDIWLNEGFATWMENKAADHFHPEWRVWLQDLASKEAAMQEDALPGAHPVVASVSDAGQAETLFDLITYSKGAAVIRMLEAYVGEDAWRAGVRRYLKAHAYAAAASEDLWRAMDVASPRPITAMAHDFTLKPGAPLIGEQGLVCAEGRTLVELKEERMAVGRAGGPAEAWRTPVFVQALGASPASVVVPGAAPVQARTDGCAPLVLNAGQTGYFRSRYALAGLTGLLDRYRALHAADQLGVLNDVAALAAAGEEPMADLMRVTKAVPSDADPVVLGALAARLEDLDRLFQDRPGRERLRAYARRRLEPLLATIGWDARPGESDNAAVLRSSLITVLGRLDDPAVLAEARRRLAAQDADPAHADPAIRRLALYFMAVHADRSDWARLHALATSSSTELGRQQAYILLADADDPVLAEEALDLALSGEPAPTTGPDMIRAVAERHPALAFGFATAHWSRIAPQLEPGARSEFIPDLLATAYDPSLIPKLDAFVKAHVPPSERAAADRAAAAIREADRVRSLRLPEVDSWLSQAL